MPGIIYLACPYTSYAKAGQADRLMRLVNRYAAILAVNAQGRAVFSPLSQGHSLVEFLPTARLADHDFWMTQCLPILEHCSEFWLLALPDWAQSSGVKAELELAQSKGIPVTVIHPDDDTVLKFLYKLYLEPVHARTTT